MTQGLVIPVDVQALCVSQQDMHGDHSFRMSTADFSPLPYLTDDYGTRHNWGPCLADKVTATRNTKWAPGVYLHWALPDALAHGHHDNSTGQTHFPVVPNRWLITRLVKRGGGLALSLCKSWVIESDQLSVSNPDPARTSPPVVTVPVKPADYDSPDMTPTHDNPPHPQPAGKQAFRYLGNQYPYGRWTEGQGAEYLYQGHQEYKLTAICYGNPTFSGFFPDCASVFGFFDDPASLGGVASSDHLAYHVVGWYCPGAASDDPLITATPVPAPAPEPSASDIANKTAKAKTYAHYLDAGPKIDGGSWTYIEALEWLYTRPAVGQEPSYSLCSGRVEGISWNNSQHYLTDPTPTTQMAVGNTSAEALSALVKQHLEAQSVEINSIEDILNTLQLGMLDEWGTTGSGADYARALHRSYFSSKQGGILWQVMRDGGEAEADLSATHARALEQINAQQLEVNGKVDQIETLGRQIFADWTKYQVFLRTTLSNLDQWADTSAVGRLAQEIHQNPSNAMNSLVSEATALEGLIDGLQTELRSIASQVGTLRQALGASYQIRSVPAPKFWQANDPVIVLSGDLIDPIVRYGGDGRLRQDGYLECRLTGEVIPSSDYRLPLNRSVPFYTEIAALVAEAAAGVLGGLPGAAPADKKLPSTLGVTTWNGTPWLPLFMTWDVDYRPIQEIPHATPTTSYPANLVTQHYAENTEGTDLVPTDETHASTAWTCSGSALLTAHPAENLHSMLEGYLSRHSSTQVADSLRQVEQHLGSLQVLSQSLDGFHKSLLMRQQSMQLTIADPVWQDQQTGSELPVWQQCAKALYQPAGADPVERVLQRGGWSDLAPDSENNFSPIRAGYIQVNQLHLTDVFGRVVDLPLSTPAVARSLVPPNATLAAAGFVSLAPRFAQPCRLRFDWLSADSGQPEVTEVPASSPICGWILFNHLENSLGFYSNTGHVIGSLILSQDATSILWQGAPGTTPWPQSLSDSFSGQDAHLMSLAQAIEHNGASYFAAFLHTLDRSLGAIAPTGGAKDSGTAVLLGRPLALARASLALDLQGGAMASQSWETFKAAVDTYSEATQSFDHSQRLVSGYRGVHFPVRLGDAENPEDSLVGYFLSGDLTHLYSQAANGASSQITAPTLDTLLLDGGSSAEVTLLFDPRGQVQATTGIVPVRDDLRVPPSQYADALAGLKVSFLAAPLLEGAQGPSFPVPKIGHGSWSWTTLKPDQTWSSSPISQNSHKRSRSYSPQRLVEGWLELSEEEG